MNPVEAFVNFTIRCLTGVVCRVHGEEFAKVPAKGPLIIAANHVNFLEVPVVYTRLRPRPVTGFAKAETWDNPLLRPLFDLWGAIPLARGQADMGAIRAAISALEDNRIVAVAPEGTRSSDGQLGKGKPGIVTLALKSGAPVLPLVYYGHEAYLENFHRLRRTDFFVRVGRPFRLVKGGGKLNGEMRQLMVDEIMFQLARLLPPQYRGCYQDVEQATTDHIAFT